ncbi:hypothetical protein H2201_008221 [Coniosporium apollinis]|uniref:Carboxylic ester hydrolase n=1 Tax=Coniosporium apollinis TaxID=61459 RepID=A0ABQ9NM02_9PEZI|nr:hypothetical protein H2201_008221 [Coniosporium apollinis]
MLLAAKPKVTIASGPIAGTSTKLASATVTVDQYLGIPFAKSPPERFSPPEDPLAWKKELDASGLKPACIQQFNYPESTREFITRLYNNPPVPESEDCLYLNVYAPSSKPPPGGRAVLFWIYGGNLVFGSGGLPAYDGTSFAANQDVIVVTPNYRTNVFGFPNSAELPAGSQNPGFLDQRKALAWVQQNIAAFGGDPSKVTIFGESAGGYSVKQLVSVPPNPLPFRAAIMQSQAAALDGGSAGWEALSAALGCQTAPSEIECVRAASATDIKSIIERNALDFPPVVDGVTQTSNVAAAITFDTAAQVPLLIGTNSEEGRVFAVGIQNVDDQLAALIPGQPLLQAAIKAAYSPAVYTTPYRTAAAIITDLVFQCPAAALANLAASTGYDVWRYWFDASFPNTQYFPDAGVYHGSEITQVFGTYPREGATEQQVELSKYMQTAWANFAKDPAKGPGWPKLRSQVLDLQDLGGRGSSGGFNIAEEAVDFRCAIYAPIIAVRGL